MVARKPSVMVSGQLQDLPDGDTVVGTSLAVGLPISGQVSLSVKQVIQRFTVADRKITAGMAIFPSISGADTMRNGIIALARLASGPRSGSFDIVIVQLQIDGKSPPSNNASRIVNLNYIGVL